MAGKMFLVPVSVEDETRLRFLRTLPYSDFAPLSYSLTANFNRRSLPHMTFTVISHSCEHSITQSTTCTPFHHASA